MRQRRQMTAPKSDDVTPTSSEGPNLGMTEGAVIIAGPSDEESGAAKLHIPELKCGTVERAGVTARRLTRTLK